MYLIIYLPLSSFDAYCDDYGRCKHALERGALRELHWHITAEWAYVLEGSCRVVVVNSEGQNYIADVEILVLPSCIPHVIQGLNDTADGCEFLLVCLRRRRVQRRLHFLSYGMDGPVPKEVLSKNFQVNASAFDHIPDRQLWMLPSAIPTGSAEEQGQGQLYQASRGTVKVVDSRTFEVSKTIALAEVTVEVGGMRELHWHPTQPEWSTSWRSTHTVFAAQGNARTFNYQAGDIGYVPPSFGHYVENIGNTTLKFLEIFNSDKYEDISLNQWLALTPQIWSSFDAIAARLRPTYS
ncbi:oxalate decarboxylase [Rhizoctonia solani]|uniref:Oxalate decarboxylase n=1 Tax=Rhizoctonia solani TaxID=456999 RepID=A0A8H8P742_9AGAM|nr:oxalate decarboxylase [Rhizoctonia solani]QRW25013.1 oxalate decarboxylase [Rhizoctonia solani]